MPVSARIMRARGLACPYCGQRMDGRKRKHRNSPSRDHVYPRSKGGRRTIIVCNGCNSDKGNLTLDEWALILLRRRDRRAQFVMFIARGLTDGRLRLTTGNVIGLADGVFA